ncbi:MAG: FAD binding domain-containing protein [Acidobacteriota bacterium]|nr:FAD binding domain-containing protein [Acidobacteriota bacterium]
MVKFILNNETIGSDLPAGTTVLDFVRYHKNLKGTKIGCREGDCGACTILVGEINDDSIKYRSMTSCLMPLANADGKHIVTVEGINKPNNELTEVQRAMVDESGTQCGFCTVGFVMSLTGFCLDETEKSCEMAISSIDGNICRCTGYKSIERAAESLTKVLNSTNGESRLAFAVEKGIVPEYFSNIRERIRNLKSQILDNEDQRLTTKERKPNSQFIGGGTDLYVQRREELVYASAENLFDDADLRFIEETNEFIEVGASVTVTDLLVSPVMQKLFPNLYKHLKLVSSTPIRNMATLAGNFVNASPIGDMTAWFLALDAEIILQGNLGDNENKSGNLRVSKGAERAISLKDFFLGYKQLAKTDDEFIAKIRFRKDFSHFNFEKVCKRTFLDIASVNTAISLKVESNSIIESHVSAGGVAPIPLYLRKTSEFLRGKEISAETISQANEILQTEISPISDVRGSADYKRLLLKQLFMAHFVELFNYQFSDKETKL